MRNPGQFVGNNERSLSLCRFGVPVRRRSEVSISSLLLGGVKYAMNAAVFLSNKVDKEILRFIREIIREILRFISRDFAFF